MFSDGSIIVECIIGQQEEEHKDLVDDFVG